MTGSRNRDSANGRSEDAAAQDEQGLGYRPAAGEGDRKVDSYCARAAYALEDAIISRLIEGEIVPRLVVAHRRVAETPQGPPLMPSPAGPEAGDVATLTRLVLARDESAAVAYVDGLCARGVSLSQILLDLLAPVARRLGEMWTNDDCAFADVTIGLSRLQQVMRAFSHEFQNEGGQRAHGRRVLLAPGDGEQHSFGMLMVGEFMSRAGWDVSYCPSGATLELIRMVRRERFAVIGLSLSAERLLDSLAETIAAVRRASRNPKIGVLVGGGVFMSDATRVARIGADAMAADGLDAVCQADALRAQVAMAC